MLLVFAWSERVIQKRENIRKDERVNEVGHVFTRFDMPYDRRDDCLWRGSGLAPVVTW